MQQNGSATVLFQRARDPLFSVLLEDERVQKRCVRVVLLVHIANFKRKRTLTFLRLLPRAPVPFQFLQLSFSEDVCSFHATRLASLWTIVDERDSPLSG